LLSSPDSKYITEALVKVLSADSLRDEMGKRSRFEVVNNYSWDVLAGNILETYHEVLQNGGFHN
jgi:glycosyltransferase involved in cell wall biosynthesis